MWKTLCLLLLLTATCSAGPLSAHQVSVKVQWSDIHAADSLTTEDHFRSP